MKSKKKVAIAGCAVALTLSTAIVITFSGKETEDKVAEVHKDNSSKSKTGKKKATASSQEIRTVYEAIKENKIAPYIYYHEEGGSLNEVVEVDGRPMTLAEAVVHHERLEFIHKAASLTLDQASHHNHEKSQDPKSLLSENKNDSPSPLVPLLQVMAQTAKPEFKAKVLGLSKNNPEVMETMKGAASEILPEIVETCDQDQISFLGDLGANPMAKNNTGKNALNAAGQSKCLKAISYWKKDQKIDFDKKNEEGISGFDVLAKFKDPELQSFTDKLQNDTVREISSLKPKAKRVSFYKKRVPSAIIDPEALVEPELRPDEATETAEFSEFSD